MRRAAKVDANQPRIVEALRDAGCSVQTLHGVGDGVPDLLVGRWMPEWGGVNFLLEVKADAKAKKRKGSTAEAQEKWRREWRGPTVAVVTSVDEALSAVGILLRTGLATSTRESGL